MKTEFIEMIKKETVGGVMDLSTVVAHGWTKDEFLVKCVEEGLLSRLGNTTTRLLNEAGEPI